LLDIVHYLDAETEQVLIADSVRMGLRPGDFAFFTPDRVASVKGSAGFSTHEGDLLKVLEFAEAMGGLLPPISIMGIEPAEIADGPGLSDTLQARFDEYVAAAVKFLTSGAA
jgi:hydrogenase maturation protease